MTLTEKKHQRYERLSIEATQWSAIDDRWCSTDPPDPRWTHARTIDDQLVAMRTDDAVNESTYHLKCIALWTLYTSA